jgi:hypothetical protein
MQELRRNISTRGSDWNKEQRFTPMFEVVLLKMHRQECLRSTTICTPGPSKSQCSVVLWAMS